MGRVVSLPCVQVLPIQNLRHGRAVPPLKKSRMMICEGQLALAGPDVVEEVLGQAEHATTRCPLEQHCHEQDTGGRLQRDPEKWSGACSVHTATGQSTHTRAERWRKRLRG